MIGLARRQPQCAVWFDDDRGRSAAGLLERELGGFELSQPGKSRIAHGMPAPSASPTKMPAKKPLRCIVGLHRSHVGGGSCTATPRKHRKTWGGSTTATPTYATATPTYTVRGANESRGPRGPRCPVPAPRGLELSTFTFRGRQLARFYDDRITTNRVPRASRTNNSTPFSND